MINVLLKTPSLYDDAQESLIEVGNQTFKQPLLEIREDLELNEICLMIHPTAVQSLKRQSNSKYPSGGTRTGGVQSQPIKTTNKAMVKKSITQTGNSPTEKRVQSKKPTPTINPKSTKLVKQNSVPNKKSPGIPGPPKKEMDVLDMINNATSSVDKNL